MARRRGIGSAVGAGVGGGLSGLGEALRALALRRYESDLVGERQRELSTLNQKEALVQKAASDPAFAQRLMQSGLAEKLGLDIPGPSTQDVLGPTQKAISEAKTPLELPAEENIEADVASRGGLVLDEPDVGPRETPKPWQRAVRPPDIRSLMAARQGKQAQFEAQPADVEYMSPKGVMTKETTTVGAKQGKTFPQERTTGQEAGRQGAIQFAQTSGSERGLHTPEAIKGAAEREEALEAVRRKGRAPTEGQARAAGFLPSLMVANQGATTLEQKGVKMGLGTQTLGGLPGGPMLLPENQTKYLQHAQDFLNFATLILTGVTARPDEYKRYFGTLFTVAGERPSVVVQKQRSRKAFIEAVKARAARGETFPSLDTMMQTIMGDVGAGETSRESPDALIERFRQETGGIQ